ncbi:hypothetical protein DFJ74DRAFT_743226 [Hyaloraphidium curvatum]|nr:hypothetical protein DFJ74DRAFT_743226 [Hyaloraphidium curvatum]
MAAERVAAGPPRPDASLAAQMPVGLRVINGCRAHLLRAKTELFSLAQPAGTSAISPERLDGYFSSAERGSPYFFVAERFGAPDGTQTFPGPPGTHPVVGLVLIDEPDGGRGEWYLDVYTSEPASADFLAAYGKDRARTMAIIGVVPRVVVLGVSPSVSEGPWTPLPRDHRHNLIVRPALPVFDLPHIESMWKRIGWGYDEVPGWLDKTRTGDKAAWVVTPGSAPDEVLGCLVVAFSDLEGDPDMCDLASGLISLSYLGVHPDLHGKGLGSYLLDWADNETRLMGWKAIALNTGPQNPAQKLYERKGFRFVKLAPREWALQTMVDLPVEERVAKFYRKDL